MTAPLNTVLWNEKDQLSVQKISHGVAVRFSSVNCVCVPSLCRSVCSCQRQRNFHERKPTTATGFQTNREKKHHKQIHTHTMMLSTDRLYSHFIESVRRVRQMTHFTWREIGRKCVRKIDGSKANEQTGKTKKKQMSQQCQQNIQATQTLESLTKYRCDRDNMEHGTQ